MRAIYLAGPYSHPDAEVMEIRERELTYAAATLMECGYVVYSPITHGHPISKAQSLPGDFDYWMKQSLHFLLKCDMVAVLCLDGWVDSVGIRGEVTVANDNGIPIEYLTFGDVL